MRCFGKDARLGFLSAILFGAGIFLGGCAATINHTFDPMADFSTGKSYSWASGWLANRQEPLIEKNVRYFADKSLREKGFTLSTDKPDFMLSMNYELEYSDPYRMRLLNLFVHKTPGKELIWQGTAHGAINADAASPDLAETVKKILMNFPPKR